MEKDRFIQELTEKDKIIKALIAEVKQLNSRLDRFEKRIVVLEAENKELKAENKKLKAENARLTFENKALKIENEALRADNTALKARLNQNSKNSSKPPSSEGYQKKPAFPRPKKGKQGGQKGHKGRTLKQVSNPDHIIRCTPEPCTCGHPFSSQELVMG